MWCVKCGADSKSTVFMRFGEGYICSKCGGKGRGGSPRIVGLRCENCKKTRRMRGEAFDKLIRDKGEGRAYEYFNDNEDCCEDPNWFLRPHRIVDREMKTEEALYTTTSNIKERGEHGRR